MTLTTLDQRHPIGPQLNTFTTTWILLLLAAFNFWIPISNAATVFPRDAVGRRDPIAGGVELRVLPIGDSITFGVGSSDMNGYRDSLFNKLTDRGNKVDFVGQPGEGNMKDDDNEGHRAKTIDGISQNSGVGIAAAANIVLLHAGTNDCNQDFDVANAPSRLKTLISKILKSSPKAAIFVAQLIPARKASVQACIVEFNKAIPGIVSSFNSDGKKLTLVAMNEALTLSEIKDDLHPNDEGFEKMANAWYSAIQSADSKGWIKEPGTPTTPEGCRSTPSWYNTGKIANGAKVAKSDGDFAPSWAKPRVVAEGACPRAQLSFFDLDGDGLKDYACVDEDSGAVKVWLNIPDSDGKTSGNWNKLGTIKEGIGRPGSGVLFADLNGDGLDDYIYVNPDGEVDAWINQSKGKDWQWKSIGQIAKPSGYHATAETLQMVDIDGDGRADFCIVDPDSGAVTAWLNGGSGDVPNFRKLGVIAAGRAPGHKVHLGDYTGEGRADYMTVGVDGKVHGSTNRLQEQAGLVPRWLEPIVLAEGPTGAERDDVRLVDLTGDGKVDYLLVDKKTGKVELWENTGKGGKFQPGEGVFLCDLDGDGAHDYFWIDETGKGWGYLNVGKGTDGWKDLGNTATGNHKREQVRMGVLTNTGRADYIVVEEKTGRADWFQNLGSNGNYGWAARGEGAAGPKNTIESTWGWKFSGNNVRFADLDGDGYDDYLYVNENGAVVMWRNLQSNPITWGVPKLVADGPVNVVGQEVQFADTNGDGRLDYVVVDRYNGLTRTWHNLGFRDDGSIRWNTPLSFADGTGSSGFAIKIVDMTGDGRADYTSINPDDGRINLWTNRCWATSDPAPPDDGGGGGGGGGGDDDDDEEDMCEDAPKTYSSSNPGHEGEYTPWGLSDGKTGRRYITIVNLTPHTFKLTSTSDYQMDEFNWDDIPSGKARQNVAHYGGGFAVDTNGEAYYNIGNTGKKFVVRATTHIDQDIPDWDPPGGEYNYRIVFDLRGMNKGQREYRSPEQEVPVTLVITGSDSYGFITSLYYGATANWMHSIKDVIKDRKLTQVVMPGTHDAGMSKITDAILTGASSTNTQTQGLNIYNQLVVGSRWFDLRVQTVHNSADTDKYSFWTTHINSETGEAPVGRSGEKLSEVIEEINQFTDESPGEVIIFQVKYLNGIRNVPSLGPIYWDKAIKDEFFDKLKQIKNRCGGLKDFQDTTMGDYMAMNDGKGCVLLFLDPKNLKHDLPPEELTSPTFGLYGRNDISWTDAWPQKKDTKAMAEWAIDSWKNRKNFHVAQWLVSVGAETSTFVYSLEEIGVLLANPALYWKGVNDISPETFPNVLMVDYIGQVLPIYRGWEDLSSELVTLAIGLNLYTISESCTISPKWPPLLPSKSKSRRRGLNITAGVNVNPLVSPWNGIIFANGTKIDNPPPTLAAGCVEILKKGTSFGNGTVLDKDTPNPGCASG